MSAQLRSWAQALGGDVSGRGVNCPGPGHSARDRSLSVTQDANAPDGILVHSFSGDDPIACKDYVREKLGLSPFKPGSSPRIAPQRERKPVEETPADNACKASWLWSIRELITEDCPVGLYLRGPRRYSGQFPPTLGYLPPNGKHPPAMIAAFGFCNEPEPGVIDPPPNVTGIHITRLTPGGCKAPIEPVKIMLGPSMGLPIVLAPANDLLAIDITEGIETGLSVLEMRGAGVWAAGAAGRMPAVARNLPGYVECLHIFAERDGGFSYAQEAARIAAARGIETHLKEYGAQHG